MLILDTRTETDAFIFATELQGSEKVIQYSKELGVRTAVHAGVWCPCACAHVRVCACMCMLVSVCESVSGCEEAFWKSLRGTGPAEQSKPPLPCSLGRVSLQPGRGTGCPALPAAPIPRSPVSKAVNERSPKAVAGRAVPTRGAVPWRSVAEDSPRQLVR